jgi:hypothetical protein
MQTIDHAQAFEDRFHHLVVAVADLLALEMDEIFLTLVHDAPPHGPQHRTAEAANRIVVLCRRLGEAIRRYEHWEILRRQEEEEQLRDAAEDVPF